MPQRLINEAILVVRDGKRVKPEIGKSFNLTADEIAQLEKVRPQAIGKVKGVEEDPQSRAADEGDGDQTDTNVALEEMDRDQLAELATKMDLKFAKNAGRDKLVEIIQAARKADEL